MQSVLFGYAGTRLTASGLELQCVPLPNNATSITLHSVHLFGATLSYRATGESNIVTLLTKGPVPIVLQHDNTTTELALHTPVELACKGFTGVSGSLGVIAPKSSS